MSESPITDLQFPEWQREYQEALFELDPAKLPEFLSAAESAIQERLNAISHDPNATVERQKIEEALSNLSVLKKRDGGTKAV
jgi:hypothetical protein